jgi:hypothetical protein
MSNMAEKSGSAANYQQAKTVSAAPPNSSGTGAESRIGGTAKVSPEGEAVRMRIVPKPPRQSRDEARTD